MIAVKNTVFLVISLLLVSVLTSCSQQQSSRQIKGTLFLLDASQSSIISILQREQQLRERLSRAFESREAIYFDFIRNNSTKQQISSLVSMQTIVGVDEVISNNINNDRRRTQALNSASDLWRQSLINSKNSDDCISQGATYIEVNSVLDKQESRTIAQYVCASAIKAKEIFAAIKRIGSGSKNESDYIGSDVQGAFSRGFRKLESDSRNLYSAGEVKYSLGRTTVVISSDMMQVSNSENRIIDVIADMNDDEVERYLEERIGQPSLSGFYTLVKVDGWLNTKKKFSEKERQILETYWRKWFYLGFELEEIDFGLGVIDWSVDQ